MLVTAGKRMDIFSKVCCWWFTSWFVPVSMDNSKVGKCRIACGSCLLKTKTKKTHVTNSTHFENASSKHPHSMGMYLSSFFPQAWIETLWQIGLLSVCPFQVVSHSTVSSVQAAAVESRADENIRQGGSNPNRTFKGAKGCWYGINVPVFLRPAKHTEPTRDPHRTR